MVQEIRIQTQETVMGGKFLLALLRLVFGQAYRVGPNGERVDFYWHDETMNEPGALEIQRQMFVVRWKYEAFGVAHAALNLFGAGLVPMAIVVVWVLFPQLPAAYLAVVLLVVGILHLLDYRYNFHLQNLQYGMAVQLCQQARVAYKYKQYELAHALLQKSIAAPTAPLPVVLPDAAVG